MKIIVLLALLVISISAKAHVVEAGKVTRILPEGSSVISIWLDGTDNSTLCSGGSRWTLSTSDPLYKDKYSLILMAAAQGKAVRFLHVEGSACGPFIGNAIHYVDVSF